MMQVISPRSTLISCGKLSIRRKWMMLPTKVISAWPGEPLLPAIRKLSAQKRRPYRSTLRSRTKTGPGLSSLMAIATKIADGSVTRSKTLPRKKVADSSGSNPCSGQSSLIAYRRLPDPTFYDAMRALVAF